MNILPWSSVFEQLLSARNIDLSSLVEFDQRFYKILHTHFLCYLIWSILNILLIIFLLFPIPDFWWAFFLMCASWGSINLMIYLFLYQHTFHKQLGQSVIWEKLQIQWHLENMLWLNIGLDVAYVMAGGILLSVGLLSPGSNALIYQGLAWAVILQGAMLLLFDLFFRYRHHQNHQNFRQVISNNSSPNEKSR